MLKFDFKYVWDMSDSIYQLEMPRAPVFLVQEKQQRRWSSGHTFLSRRCYLNNSGR